VGVVWKKVGVVRKVGRWVVVRKRRWVGIVRKRRWIEGRDVG